MFRNKVFEGRDWLVYVTHTNYANFDVIRNGQILYNTKHFAVRKIKHGNFDKVNRLCINIVQILLKHVIDSGLYKTYRPSWLVGASAVAGQKCTGYVM